MSAPRRIGVNAGSVTVTDAHLHITALLVEDPDVLAAAHRADAAGQPLEVWLLALLRAGAVALAAVGSSRDLTETVRRTGEQMDEAVRRSSDQLVAVVKHAVDPEQGPLALATRTQVDRLSEGVARLVTGTDAVLPSSVRASVTGVTSEVLAEIQRALGTQVMQVQHAVSQDRQLLSEGLHVLLSAHSTTVTQQLTGLQAQLTASAAPRVRSSALIGAEHEDAVVAVLCRIAQGAGDLCTSTGTITGLTGNKIGDATVDLGNPRGGPSVGRIVIEAKDRSAPLSSAKLLEELQAGCHNRGAQAGILVCASAAQLPGGESLVILSDHLIAVAWTDGQDIEVLRAAFLLLKLGIVRGTHATAATVDVAELRRRATRVVQHLTGFDRLERLAGTTGKNLRSLVEQTAVLRQQLAEELDALSAALSTTT